MTEDSSPSDEQKIAELRELLPATSAGIYLDTATRGPLPAEVAAAMREADDWELRVGRATEGRDEDFQQRVEEARAVLAALVSADPSDVVITAGVAVALDIARRMAPGSQLAVVHLVEPNTGAVAADSGQSRPYDLSVAVDATLAAGARPVDVHALDAEFVVFAADRWLLGPEETAALWISPRARSSDVVVPDSLGLGRTVALGLARSVGWIEMYVGLDWAHVRTQRLTAALIELLTAVEGVTVATPRGALAGIVSFSVTGWEVEQVLDELRRRVFAIIGPSEDGQWVRASVAWFNTEDEIETFTGAVREIASSTPDSIPRRLPLLNQ